MAKPTEPTKGKTDPKKLALDLRNPRLAQHLDGTVKERDVIQDLILHADLPELMQSIASNGYLDFEPLILVKEGRGPLIVIEGNRRVAAVKVLLDPSLAQSLGVAPAELTKEVRASLTEVSYIEVATRDDARQYIGFKHINGPHKWDSYAKAKFAADWYRAESANGVTLRDIARRLGDRHDTVQRLVQGMFVLEQASESGVFSVDDRYQKRPFAFSHLYTALTRPQYREYLGLEPNWRQVDPKPKPIAKPREKKLGKVLRWMYGSEDERVPPLVTSQNPHIKQLGEVLANPLALRKLETTNDLAEAYSEVDSRSRKFSDNLLKAVEYAQYAQSVLDAYEGDAALLQYGERLSSLARTIHQTMKVAKDERAS